MCLVKQLLNPLKLEFIRKNFIWSTKSHKSTIFKIFGSVLKKLFVDFQLPVEVHRWWIYFVKYNFYEDIYMDSREILWPFAY